MRLTEGSLLSFISNDHGCNKILYVSNHMHTAIELNESDQEDSFYRMCFSQYLSQNANVYGEARYESRHEISNNVVYAISNGSD